MDSKKDKGRTSNNGKYVVVLLEEPEKISQWKNYLLGFSAVFCLAFAMGAGYLLFSVLNPPNQTMQMQKAAKTLGIPMTGKNLLGVTFVKGSPSGDTMGFTSKCPNCNYEGMTLTLQYPKEPGPGWRAYDLAPDIKGFLTTPTVVAMEAK